jgi:hemerythrin-like metal-binding protein
MALMTWRDQYSVGVETLDNQHKAILRILNEIHAASLKGKAQEVAGPLLSQLLSLASEHFSTEERLMASIKFPGLPGHRAEHQRLTGKLREFVSRHEKGDASAYTQLLHFLRDWLNQHMQSEDQEYAPWLVARGVR